MPSQQQGGAGWIVAVLYYWLAGFFLRCANVVDLFYSLAKL
jgi:hypothetical protein